MFYLVKLLLLLFVSNLKRVTHKKRLYSSQTRCASAIREMNVLLHFSLMGFTPINAASVSNIPPRIIYSV